MKKLITLASAGVFLLSLQGASLAQDKTPAPIPAAPATPAAPPAATVPSVTPAETPAAPETKAAKKTKTDQEKDHQDQEGQNHQEDQEGPEVSATQSRGIKIQLHAHRFGVRSTRDRIPGQGS